MKTTGLASPGVWADSKESRAFPEYYAAVPAPGSTRMTCTAKVDYVGGEQVRADIDNLRAAMVGVDVADAFIPSISPTNSDSVRPRNPEISFMPFQKASSRLTLVL